MVLGARSTPLLDRRPPPFSPVPHGDPSGLGIEVLVGVELVTNGTFEPFGIGFAIEGALPGNRIPVTHHPGGPA
jgi:hypothetical protein